LSQRVPRSHLTDLIKEFKEQYIDENEAYSSIDFAHHEVHEENSFNVCATAAATASKSISFKTGTGKQLHIILSYATESAAHVEVKEGVAITATSGTEDVIINRDRNSSKISTVLQNKSGAFVADNKVLIDATTVGGTIIADHKTWSTKHYGVQRRGNGEWILKEDTEYEIILTSDDGSKGLHLELNWYEI